jgi:hypothetical protein
MDDTIQALAKYRRLAYALRRLRKLPIIGEIKKSKLKGEHMQNVFKELWFQVMVAMVPGVVTGILLSPSGA